MSGPDLDCLFRVDAGPGVRFGHLRRCLVLAGALRKMGLKRIGFLTRTGGALEAWIPKCYTLLEIEPRDSSNWAKALSPRPPRLTVIDSYRISGRQLMSLKKSLPAVVMIDDQANRSGYPVDGVINYHVNAKKTLYPVLQKIRLFLGPRYAPIAAAF